MWAGIRAGAAFPEDFPGSLRVSRGRSGEANPSQGLRGRSLPSPRSRSRFIPVPIPNYPSKAPAGLGRRWKAGNQKLLPAKVLDGLEEHLQNSQYFRFLWFPHTENVRVIYQDPTEQPPSSSSSWFWDYAVGYHLLEFLLWISSFFPSLVVWINRVFFRLLFSSRSENVDRSHRVLNYECRFRQHVQDWAIPIGSTRAALLELKAALDRDPGIGAHFPVEIRFCRRDEIPLSPCFRRDSCYINVIMYRPYGREAPRGRYWLLYEGIMRRHGGRPHWAKAHSCTRKDLEGMFPEFQKFCALRERLDPDGTFLNPYLEKIFF